ncbi:hypothetical protein PR202_ga15516 [Eleusine coracana subsp. coracana]|uniref:Uncharacterized protein n=1 Tax=Eleusine coracana subsp. coracana TaxID=191504 RepID=A0AAV5CKL3_ELECO|nr:hypothetical protein PR202_ga15516 [Eleusine coracana subsp. coracana]
MWTATNTEAAVELSAMWRLKTSEGGGQWMQTVSEFHGRQVWEFHSDAGTEEERAQVERLRREFTDNRFQRRESSDLLMRMQCVTYTAYGIETSSRRNAYGRETRGGGRGNGRYSDGVTEARSRLDVCPTI